MSQYDQYPSSPGGVGDYARLRALIVQSPIRVISPDSDGGRYEFGHQDDIVRGSPPTHLSQGKRWNEFCFENVVGRNTNAKLGDMKDASPSVKTR